MPYIKETAGEDCSLEPIAICGMGTLSPEQQDHDSVANFVQRADCLEQWIQRHPCGSY